MATSDERAEVELSIQIGMETDEEALAVLIREATKAARKVLAVRPPRKEYVHEIQWCAGAMRVTLRRPHLEEETRDPPSVLDPS